MQKHQYCRSIDLVISVRKERLNLSYLRIYTPHVPTRRPQGGLQHTKHTNHDWSVKCICRSLGLI